MLRLFKTILKLLLPLIERCLSVVDRAFSNFIQPRRRMGELLLQPYVGWGTPRKVELSGRVLLPHSTTPPKRNDTRWNNFLNIGRRLFSREVGGVFVVGQLCGQRVSAVSDSDGYFTLQFEWPHDVLKAGWHAIHLHMPQRKSDGRTVAPAQIVDSAHFGVISDIDDTIIQSDVSSLTQMLFTVLTGNAQTRLPFPGVGALYRAFTREQKMRNPIFYVSSSPWNFFDLLWQFLNYRAIPLGPMFLRNWGMDVLAGHKGHKNRIIYSVLDAYPQLPFVLVGDSGEEDPEIYAEVVRRYPKRILAVYIRDVSKRYRDAEVQRLSDELREAGVHLVLAADSLGAATHALALGLITPNEYRNIINDIHDAHDTHALFPNEFMGSAGSA